MESPKEPPKNLTMTNEGDDPIIELGDRIRINGGKYDKTTGRVIYRSIDELHLMPDGLTNTALEFSLTEEGFDEESGVESIEILQKRKKPGVIDILDLNVDQVLETFGSDGEALSKYTIVRIIPEEDSIIIKNEEEGEVVIPFGFRGIPKDLPFRVVRSRQAPTGPQGPQGDIRGERQDEEGDQGEEGDGALEEEEEDLTFLDDELEDSPAQDEDDDLLVKIPRSERIFSHISQKSEAYVDLLSLNTPALQKLNSTQKATRVLTELFFQLRSSILRQSEDGSSKGIKPTSIQTLADALETRQLMLSRPVIDIDKILYHDMDPATDPQPDGIDGVKFQYFTDKVEESVKYLDDSTNITGQKYNTFLNGYLNRYSATWRPASSPQIAFQRDEEVFRRKAPDSESNIPGYPRYLPDPKKGDLSSEMVGEIGMSLLRGLKAIRTRSQLIQMGEEAAVLAYIIFPLIYSSSLTTVRLESLVADIEAGLVDMASIRRIIKSAGEITDIPSQNQPFLVSVDGGTLGNIPLREYLKSAGIRAEGMGDIWPLQIIMGMQEREWTIDQQAILVEAITTTQNQILGEILKQRELLAQHVSQPAAVQGIQMTPDGPQLIEKLAGEPYLRDVQQTIKEQMPAFANSDVTLVGLLLRHHPEMAFAQLADQPASLTRARMKYARDEYLLSLQNNLKKKQRIEFAGVVPEPIHCAHVKPLQMIRKVKDDKIRLALLSKFLMTFQGTKEDNWVQCNAGDHNLLCVHELLQIYQYLRPGDVAVLNKDIQLNFGGGQFQGFYICRNCGQPISELEYDTHLEFDDNGRPMMGRSELVDKDAITQEEIENLVGPMGDLEIPEEFNNETKRLIYTTSKQLADKLFAPLETPDFLLIVARVYGIIQQIPTRDRYIQIQKAQRKGKTVTAATVSYDYDVYINQALVCAVGVHMLILIQSKVPEFILRGTPMGCRSLRGQPLEEGENTDGIKCIITVIASFQKDTPPWNLTQFQKDPDVTTRQKTIMGVFEPILRASLQDPTILQALSQKRDYRRKILGAAGGQGRPDEILPDNFAPIPHVITTEEFVEKVIIPEAAKPRDRAELWIRQGNYLAKHNKLPMPLAFSETSCCLSSLDNIDEFWNTPKVSQSLPPFPKRTGVPSPPKITRTEPTMKPSLIVRPLPDAPENSYYLLFLKVCYDGERKGHTHEFGLTHMCFWCGLKLPYEAEILTAEQSRSAIESQGIDISKESFEDLLNETHRVNSFKTTLHLEVPGPLDNWNALTKMEPEPALGYREVMTKTQLALMSLPVDAKEVEVALALSEFSVLAGEMESAFKARLPPTQHALFDSLISNGAESIVRFLQSYVTVPLQQLLSKYVSTPSIPKAWALSQQHQVDVIRILNAHRGYLGKFNKVEITLWLKAKIETFLSQARAIIDALELLRPLQVPGGVQTYGFFLKFCLFAPLANFVDPNVLPLSSNSIEKPESQVEPQALFPAKFVSEMVVRFRDEGFRLTPEQIRELIAKRNEMEKDNIIKKMNDMSRAGKDIEKIKMKLGLGDWALGGTKGVYAYDQERYDIERDQRAQAGIIDFPGYGPEGPGAEKGQTDGLGYYNTGDEAGYIGDEDLADAMGFDDE